MTIFEFANGMGEFIHNRWKRRGFAPELFPELSVRVLNAYSPANHINLDNALTSMIRSGIQIPSQRPLNDARFGQSALTLYNDAERRFFIELNCWAGIDRAIYDSHHCGATMVLHGVSRLETLSFCRTGGNDDLQTGTLKSQDCKELLPGDVHKIAYATDRMYRTHHLSRPTLTLMVGMTSGQPGNRYVYMPGGLAMSCMLTTVESKHIEWLEELLILHKHEAAMNFISEMAKNSAPDGDEHFRVIRPCALFKAADQFLNMTWRFDKMDALIELIEENCGPGYTGTLRDVFTQKMRSGR